MISALSHFMVINKEKEAWITVSFEGRNWP